MMKRTLTKKLAIAASASALAFGAAACQVEEGGSGLDPAQEDPLMEEGGDPLMDEGGDPLMEGGSGDTGGDVGGDTGAGTDG